MFSVKWEPLSIGHNALNSQVETLAVILQKKFLKQFKFHQVVSKLHINLKINLETHSAK